MVRCEKPTNEMLGFVEDEYGALSIDDIIIPPPPAATLSHDVPDKRLIIIQLKIKNFKSYAGEVVLGPFDKNFTAIVGPNGSGKSNVIDSLLFVFGYRAKKIRTKKVSHLIHKSDQHPNINSCSVHVRFAMIKENKNTYEIIPNSSFSISRTAFSDDNSYYEMNNKRVLYKDVARTLRRYYIDLDHSRFLILQGEIEAISLMHPKASNEHETGMLEYIEDIIGSNRYIEPIQQFHGKVEKLKEEIKEKQNILKLVEKDRDQLEEPKNKAIRYLRLENSMILNENSLLYCKRFALEKDLNKIVEEIKKYEEKLNEIKQKISEIKMTRKTQDSELEKNSSQLDLHLKNCEKYKEAYKTLERQDVQFHEDIKHLKNKIVKMESSITSTKIQLNKLNKQREIFEKETSELQLMKKKLDAEKLIEEKKLSEAMDSMQKDTYNIQENKDKLEAKLIKMKNETHSLKSEMDLLQSELDIYLRTYTKEKKILSDLICSYENSNKSAKEENILLEREKEQISNLEKKLPALKQQISDSQQKEISLADELKSNRLIYEEAKNSLSTFKSRSVVMQAFAREKVHGRLTGVIGRLGDLGAIDEKYDVAISTACPALDNIVTDNIETAEDCITYLKKNNLGYVTFIPLDVITKKCGKFVDIKMATPENIPRLFDLIRVKDKALLPAFYHAVGNTLVSSTIDQATRIGLQGTKRYRVVSLKGELVDTCGTMSGGGGRPYRGRMGQTVIECSHTPEELSKLSFDIDSLSEVMLNVRKHITNLQEEFAQKSKEYSSLQLSIKKRQSNYKAYITSSDMLHTQIEDQKRKIKGTVVDDNKVKELREKIERKKINYTSSANDASEVEEKVAKMQEEILKITKGTLNKTKKNVDDLSKKVSDVSQSITKSAVNIKTCKRNIKKAEEKLKTLEDNFENAKKAKSEQNEKRDASVSKAREFIDKQQQEQVQVNKLMEQKSALKKKLETFHEQEHQLKMEEITQKNCLKECEASEGEKRSIIQSINNRLSKLKLNEVEDDPIDIPSLSPEDIAKVNIKRVSAEIDVIKVQMQDIKPDLGTIPEYKKKEKLCEEKQKDLDAVVHEKNMQVQRYDELRQRRLSEFMKGFTAIAKKLKEIYQMITLGGDAEMELVDTFDPFSKGIEFSVRPPKKSWKFMRNLSGGEKTLSSLALVFALHYYRPTPFYVMDEIDAALDVRNVAIVGYYLKERTKNTQFIIVSLRNIMNELADHLIGIYKTNNCSKNLNLMNIESWNSKDDQKDKEMQN